MSDIAFQLEAIQLEWSSSNDSSLKEKPPFFCMSHLYEQTMLSINLYVNIFVCQFYINKII